MAELCASESRVADVVSDVSLCCSSNDGGGGERVLWKILDALERVSSPSEVELVVFSGDADVSAQDILAKAKVCLPSLSLCYNS